MSKIITKYYYYLIFNILEVFKVFYTSKYFKNGRILHIHILCVLYNKYSYLCLRTVMITTNAMTLWPRTPRHVSTSNDVIEIFWYFLKHGRRLLASCHHHHPKTNLHILHNEEFFVGICICMHRRKPNSCDLCPLSLSHAQ